MSSPRADGNVIPLDSHVGKHPKVLELLHGSHFISFLKTRHPSCGFPARALFRSIKKHRQVSSGILTPSNKHRHSCAAFFVGSCLSDAAPMRPLPAYSLMLADFNRTDGGQFACYGMRASARCLPHDEAPRSRNPAWVQSRLAPAARAAEFEKDF